MTTLQSERNVLIGVVLVLSSVTRYIAKEHDVDLHTLAVPVPDGKGGTRMVVAGNVVDMAVAIAAKQYDEDRNV